MHDGLQRTLSGHEYKISSIVSWFTGKGIPLHYDSWEKSICGAF